MDLVSYVVFMICGGLLGAFFGWMLMRRLWRDRITENERGWWGTVLAAVSAIFLASR